MANIAFRGYSREYGSGTGVITLSFSKPSGLAEGDLMIIHVANHRTYISSSGAPSGWTKISRGSSGNVIDDIWYKIADSTDVAASTFDFDYVSVSSTCYYNGFLFVFSGVDPSNPINTYAVSTNSASSTIDFNTITPTVENCMLVMCASLYITTATTLSGWSIANDDPAGWTERYDSYYGYPMVGMAYDIRPEITATGAGEVTATNSWYNIGTIIAIAPLGANLTVSSTDYGSVTAPGEGSFDYPADEVVTLTAVADSGYQFTGWTGDTDTIADPTSANTTITMSDDYAIVANFEPDYYSSAYIGDVVDCSENVQSYTKIEWTKTTPTGTSIVMQLRSSADQVTWTDWVYKYTSPVTSFGLTVQRYLEWRAVLATTDDTVTPTLSDVDFTWAQDTT